MHKVELLSNQFISSVQKKNLVESRIIGFGYVAEVNRLLKEIEQQIGYEPIDTLAKPVIDREKAKAVKKKAEMKDLKESSNWIRQFEFL